MKYKFNLSKIKGRLAEMNLKQKDLAKLMGISEAHVSRMLKGKSSFSIDDICLIANELKVDPGIFFDNCITNSETARH